MLLALPPETLSDVLSSLDAVALVNAALASRAVFTIVDHDVHVWERAAEDLDPFAQLGPAVLRAAATYLGGWLRLCQSLNAHGGAELRIPDALESKHSFFTRRLLDGGVALDTLPDDASDDAFDRVAELHVIDMLPADRERERPIFSSEDPDYDQQLALSAAGRFWHFNAFSFGGAYHRTISVNDEEQLLDALDQAAELQLYDNVHDSLTAPFVTVVVQCDIDLERSVCIGSGARVRLVGAPAATLGARRVVGSYAWKWSGREISCPMERSIQLRCTTGPVILVEDPGFVVLENLIIRSGDMEDVENRDVFEQTDHLDWCFPAIKVVGSSSFLLMKDCDVFSETGTCVLLDDHGAAQLMACSLASHQFFGIMAKMHATLTLRGCVFRFHEYGVHAGLLSEAVAAEIRQCNTFYVTPRQQLLDPIGVIVGKRRGSVDIKQSAEYLHQRLLPWGAAALRA